MSETKLIVIRHGETEWNRQGRIQGWLDSPLTPGGLAQAQALAARLAQASPDAFYSSDLGRARQTAEIITKDITLSVAYEKRLRECNLGIFQGLTWLEIGREFAKELEAYKKDYPGFVIPEGESTRQRYERAVAIFGEIAQRHPGETVAVVTHGGILDSLFRHTLDIPLAAPRRWKLWNAGLNTFTFQDGRWTLVTWGDIRHLEGLPARDDF